MYEEIYGEIMTTTKSTTTILSSSIQGGNQIQMTKKNRKKNSRQTEAKALHHVNMADVSNVAYLTSDNVSKASNVIANSILIVVAISSQVLFFSWNISALFYF